MTRHVRSSKDLVKLSQQIMAQARERAQKEQGALQRLLGKRSHEWLTEQPESAATFLQWLNARTTEASERRVLSEVLDFFKSKE